MGSSLTTLHIYSSLVSICDFFLGCLLWCQYHIQHVSASKKDPEEVVTDRYEGAIYVQCGQRWPHSLQLHYHILHQYDKVIGTMSWVWCEFASLWVFESFASCEFASSRQGLQKFRISSFEGKKTWDPLRDTPQPYWRRGSAEIARATWPRRRSTENASQRGPVS